MANDNINMNEIRKLAKKQQGRREILSAVNFQDEVMYFTDTQYLIKATGFRSMLNCNLCPNTLNFILGEYPNVTTFFTQKHFSLVAWQQTILNGQVVYRNKNTYIDDEIINQLKRLIIMPKDKKFHNQLGIHLDQIEATTDGFLLRVMPFDNVTIVFTPKRWLKEFDDEQV